jgi:hypothetical protein
VITGRGDTTYASGKDDAARDAIAVGVPLRTRLTAVLLRRPRALGGGRTPMARISAVNGGRYSARRACDGASPAPAVRRSHLRLSARNVDGHLRMLAQARDQMLSIGSRATSTTDGLL